MINCNNFFCSIVEDVKDELRCSMNHADAQDHESHAERNNRAIENQVELMKQCKVWHNSRKADFFFCHTEDGIA